MKGYVPVPFDILLSTFDVKEPPRIFDTHSTSLMSSPKMDSAAGEEAQQQEKYACPCRKQHTNQVQCEIATKTKDIREMAKR